YAASVVFWEALTGRRLFDGETETIVLARALEGAIDPPSTYNRALNPAIDGVVMRGLARRPETRFTTAREMALAVEQLVGLASPWEGGEWVELRAGEEPARRAQPIRHIEVASLSEQRAPQVSLPKNSNEPHSQVSSISVSRPAVSVTPPKRFAGAKLLVSVS